MCQRLAGDEGPSGQLNKLAQRAWGEVTPRKGLEEHPRNDQEEEKPAGKTPLEHLLPPVL